MLSSRANALAALGRDAEAIEVAAERRRLDPASASVHASAGSMFLKLERYDEAAECLLQSLSINAASPETHKTLGLVRFHQKNLPEARHHLQQALALHPGMPVAVKWLKIVEAQEHWLRAVEATNQDRYDDAEAALTRVLEISPNHPKARATLVRLCLKQRRFDDALAEASRDLQENPNSGAANHAMARVLDARCQEESALDYALRAISHEPRNIAYYATASSLLSYLERYQESLELLDQAVAVGGDNALLCDVRAVALAGLGRREKAKALIAELISAKPDKLGSHLHGGIVYMLLKEWPESERYYLRAMEIDSTLPYCPYSLGRLYFKCGRFAEAKPLLELALKGNPHFREARDALEQIAAAG